MSNVEQFNLNGITVDVCDANARDMIGDEYDATATYAVGEYCIYNNTMKKCITAVSTPEAFDSEKWINTTIQEVLEAANTKIGTASLNTSASDLSGAINEHETDIGRIEYDLGSETLPDTTKTVKGNINAISNSLAQLKFDFIGAVTSLNDIAHTSAQQGRISIAYFTSGATGAPSSNIGGFCTTFVNIDSYNYGRQIIISNGGIWTRPLASGSYGNWTQLA